MTTVASIGLLALVLVLIASGRVHDVLTTVPVAVVVVATGLVSLDEVGDVIDRLGPTLAFLGAIFVIAEAAEIAGLFARTGSWLAARATTARRLVLVVAVAAVLVTIFMSLDATAVLFTPVVIGVVRVRHAAATRPLLVTTQLANASSSFLPVSNLTNLLVFSATGLSFGGFAARMALPTLAASGVVVVAAASTAATEPLEPAVTPEPAPLDGYAGFVVAALAVLTGAFFVSSVLAVDPAWLAVGGATVVAVVTVTMRRATVATVVRAVSPSFLLFVLGLAVVVQAAVDHGLHDLAADVLPTGRDFWSLLGMVLLAATLANVVNNLPATLVLISVIAPGATALLLAMLVGVNVGPNLSYTGSLATLLWRRVVRRAEVEPARHEFFRFAVLTTPAALILAAVALWLTLQVLH